MRERETLADQLCQSTAAFQQLNSNGQSLNICPRHVYTCTYIMGEYLPLRPSHFCGNGGGYTLWAEFVAWL